MTQNIPFKMSFYKQRYKFIAFSSLLLLIGIISAIVFGMKLDIQFKGGSIVKMSFAGVSILSMIIVALYDCSLFYCLQ